MGGAVTALPKGVEVMGARMGWEVLLQNVLAKTEKFGEDIDNLLNNLDEVGLTLDISQNEFHSLRNTQFIENRVYEDDETMDSNVEEKVVGKVSQEEQETSIFDSVIMGMSILDKYYDAVEVSLSDSEEESEKSGTESDKVSEIYSESDSEDNLPKDMLKGSESSSELDFLSQTSETRPVANSTFNDSAKKLDSTTQSDDSDREDSLPIKSPLSNRTFAEQLAAKLDSVISKEENQRINSQQIDSNSVLSKEEEINNQPIKPARSNTYGDIGGDLFFVEPPPLLDPPEPKTGLFSGGKGLFDENEDSLIWDNLTKVTSKKQLDKSEHFKDEEKIDVPEKLSFLPKSSKVSKGLFDSEDSSDDELFGFDKSKLGKTPFLQQNHPIVPLFDNEPPELHTSRKSTDESARKNPVADLFGTEVSKNILKEQQRDKENDISKDNRLKNTQENTSKRDLSVKPNISKGNQLKNTQENTSKRDFSDKKSNLFDDTDEFQSKQTENIPNLFRSQDNIHIQETRTVGDVEKNKSDIKISNTRNKVGLFEDDFDDNMNAKASKLKISLFDDDDDELFKDDLFSDVTPKKPAFNLFDDLDNSTISFTPKSDNLGNTKNEGGKYENRKHINSDKSSNIIFGDGNKKQRTVPKSEETINQQKISEEIEKHDDSVTNNVIKNMSISNSNDPSGQQLVEAAENEKSESKYILIAPSFDDDNQNGFENDAKIDETSPPGKADHCERTLKPDSKLEANMTPTIRLFDSTPPPDDDGDWDSKSDNFSYTEDFTPYQIEGNLDRSSLFDNEPPSLDANESSGIVRDQNTTRADTDDSSFCPHASSSRRLSSDIFSDQQSQDSFFITKSRMDSATASSNLGIITETTDSTGSNSDNLLESTNADLKYEANKIMEGTVSDEEQIQTSGSENEGDFVETQEVDSDEENSEDEDIGASQRSLNQEANHHTSSATSMLYSDDDLDDNVPLSTIVDTLKHVISSKNSSLKGKNHHRWSIIEPPTIDVLGHSNPFHSLRNPTLSDILLYDDSTNVPLSFDKGQNHNEKELLITDRTEVDGEANKSKILSIDDFAKSDANISEKIKGSPGKLKHNLNINVNALVPGYIPPKTREFTRSQSLDSPTDDETKCILKSNITSNEDSANGNIYKSVSLENAENIEVLPSITKDRAKIPIKRRPSTRRGRKEAIRQSVIENVSAHDNVSSDFEEKESAKESLSTTISTTENNNIQVSEDNKDEPLEIPFTSTVELVDDSKKLFGSESESDDDLFTSKKSGRNQKNSNPVMNAPKKSLFEDSSSDDDLFKSVRKRDNTNKTDPPLENKIKKTIITKKLDNLETSEDPLSDLLK
ncbi:unnamed protein product [Phaedon cochleariae]|uniref:FAM21/CAPZIP domain-containing protein n=1 Tax=Phaedon cochleariae TaxID=80249 RepID=A0A9N9X3F4_PHACE|nr:unnamed protein product [Phaedon cochleariae]